MHLYTSENPNLISPDLFFKLCPAIWGGKTILPVTPRIGEEVTIPLLEETGKFYRGYVHEIKHNITGSTQEIQLFVHPWYDYYYQWIKMKDEFDRSKSWKASMRNA